MTHKVSHFLHFPIFDKKVVARIFGLNLAGLAMVLSVVAYPTHAFDYDLTSSNQGETLTQVVVTTNSQYQFPLQMTLGMSQGFYSLHPGVDLRAPIGTPVYSIADGTVVEVGSITIGYGNYIRVAHAGTVSSLYAHLSQILVKPGQRVTKGEQIGAVGRTGWATGPHLHFEVHEGEAAVNPLNYISVK